MTIYLVFGVINYEGGVYQSSMKVFKSKEKAEKYRETLRKKRSIDRAEIMEMQTED